MPIGVVRATSGSTIRSIAVARRIPIAPPRTDSAAMRAAILYPAGKRARDNR
jgi:hypothetical protein